MEFRIDKTKAYQKWRPVLDNLGIKCKEIGMFGAEYAELLNIKEQPNTLNSLLPVNLTVLSKLNLQYRNYEFKDDDIEEINFEFNFTDDEIKSDLSGLDKVRIMENKIIESIVQNINSELEKYDTIIINRLITDMKIIDIYKWSVKCRYKFENRGNMFKIRQQVYDLLKQEFGSKFKYIKVDITMYEEKLPNGMSMVIDTDSPFNTTEKN